MRRLGAGAAALVLCLAGAAGFGPPLGGARGTLVVVDNSPSCEPRRPFPEGARLSEDSRLGRAIEDAQRAGATRVRLFTDGCDVSGRPPPPPGVPVDVVMEPRRDDLVLLSVRAPDRIPRGADFAVEIQVGRTRGPARPTVTAAVTLLRDGERVGSPTVVRLDRGAAARVLVRDRVDREGVVRYRATIEDPVGDPADDALDAVARIGERPFVLSVGGPLDAPGLTVTEVAAADAGATPFDVCDAILVHEIPGAPAQERIAEAVRNGVGLVVLGGRGVAGSPIGGVLPLTDAPPRGRAALLLLDVSGSMADLLPALEQAAKRLLLHFAPDDRVAYVLFRDGPVGGSAWTRAADASIDFRSLVGRGNTLLLPALIEAERRLGEVEGEKRLFVVSDGKWGDLEQAELAKRLAGFGGIHRAALFVQEDVPPEAKALFPVSLTSKDDLAAALQRLEDLAHDRTVASADATTASAPPPWLDGAVPPPGTYRDFVRLYPNHAGERTVLAAGAIPLVAAWRKGGKVVMAAPAVDPLPLVRAVLREEGGIRLRAWRDGDTVVAEASGGGGAPFGFDDLATVPARPLGPDRWGARIQRAGAVRVSCGPALALVPAGGSELSGLSGRPDIAAKIAASSGGRLLEVGGPGGEEEGARTMAAFVTLLLAAASVVASAWLRRCP